MTWFVKTIRTLGIQAKVWLVVDGAYAARPFLKPVLDLGIVVVSRLRKDACLYDLPSEPDPRRRGRHPIYGKNKISLAKRAAHKKGWQTITYHCRGASVTRQYKTFLATSKLVSGQIRVVIVRFEDGGWAPYFHDVKEVWGAGQQQVRNVWSNIGCWNFSGWLYTLVELCLWDKDKSELTDRSDRPWDNPHRRPSHADRRRSIAREMLQKQFLTALPSTPNHHKFRTLFEALVALAL